MKPARVILSCEVTSRLAEAASPDNRNETGGVLLGHRHRQCFYVVAITVAEHDQRGSPVSFQLDGDAHSKYAAGEISRFWFSPEILGVWHSHIVDGTVFSEQDRCSNRLMAEALNGALALVIANTGIGVQMAAEIFDAHGENMYCRILCGSERKVPFFYLLKKRNKMIRSRSHFCERKRN